MNKVSIYVCHHKAGFKFSDNTFIPIQVGKALTNVNLGILGDSTGDNISRKNPEYCELTAIYWAWKNNKTSDWIGLMHYRRFLAINPTSSVPDSHGCINYMALSDKDINSLGLNESSVQKLLTSNPKANAILPQKWSVKSAGHKNIREHYIKSDFHYVKDLDLTRDAILKLYPDDIQFFDEFMTDDSGYFTNIFILKNHLFNEYCDWLFNILFEVEKNINLTNYSTQDRRVFGYLSERLFNVFLRKKDKTINPIELKRIFIKDAVDIPIISPESPPKNAISIVVASDENFVPHLAALLESIKDNIDKSYFLDFIVLEDSISSFNKYLLHKQLLSNSKLKSQLTFIDCSHLYTNIDVHMHFARATFYRIHIDEILSNHKKVIYIDCDTIVLADLAELWNQNMEGKAVAAAPDLIMKSFVNTGTPSMKETGALSSKLYLKEYLGMGEYYDDYFQAGVIVFDLEKYSSLEISNKAHTELISKKHWFLDQDILNKHLVGNVRFIDTSWNCVNVSGDISSNLEKKWKIKCNEDLNLPKIIHYAGYHAKPWNNPHAPFSNMYFFYLRKTLWYELVTKNFIFNTSLDKTIHKGKLYTFIRFVWRALPGLIKKPFNGLAYKFCH